MREPSWASYRLEFKFFSAGNHKISTPKEWGYLFIFQFLFWVVLVPSANSLLFPVVPYLQPLYSLLINFMHAIFSRFSQTNLWVKKSQSTPTLGARTHRATSNAATVTVTAYAHHTRLVRAVSADDGTVVEQRRRTKYRTWWDEQKAVLTTTHMLCTNAMPVSGHPVKARMWDHSK
jgi:hypothetical protein